MRCEKVQAHNYTVSRSGGCPWCDKDGLKDEISRLEAELEVYQEQAGDDYSKCEDALVRAENAESKVTALVECLDYLHQSGIFAGGTELHDKCYQKVTDTLANIDKPVMTPLRFQDIEASRDAYKQAALVSNDAKIKFRDALELLVSAVRGMPSQHDDLCAGALASAMEEADELLSVKFKPDGEQLVQRYRDALDNFCEAVELIVSDYLEGLFTDEGNFAVIEHNVTESVKEINESCKQARDTLANIDKPEPTISAEKRVQIALAELDPEAADILFKNLWDLYQSKPLSDTDKRDDGEQLADKYHELIMAVETKFPDKTRHETALYYITSCEAGMPQSGSQVLSGEQVEQEQENNNAKT